MIEPQHRSSTLNLLRKQKMARSAHAYVRGSTLKFYEWLDESAARIPQGPPVWICGDCHIGNLGPLADAKGRVAVQIRDLDQTVIGNPAHDVVRLGLSLASAARSADLSGVVTSRMLEALARGYILALQSNFDVAVDLTHKPKHVRDLLKTSIRRRWQHLAAERIQDVKPRIPLGRRFWPVSDEEREALASMFGTEKMRRLITSLKARDPSAAINMADVAYWVKGCSSLGRLRFAVLLRIKDGKDISHCLVDVKEGTAAVAPRAENSNMPSNNALRVVTGAKALSPNLGGRMLATRFLKKSVVVRELMPQDLKIEVEELEEAEAVRLARYLAYAVGRAHGHQMSAEDRAAWIKELLRHTADNTSIPMWLWASVIDLMGIHEAAYLQHCREIAGSHWPATDGPESPKCHSTRPFFLIPGDGGNTPKSLKS